MKRLFEALPFSGVADSQVLVSMLKAERLWVDG